MNTPPTIEPQRVAPLAYAAFFSAVPIILFPMLFPVPLVLGLLALRSIRQNPCYAGRGRALFAIAWSGIGMALTLLVIVVLLNSGSP